MTIKIVQREVTPLIATYWYLEKMLQEVPLPTIRKSKLENFVLPDDFIRRQTTDTIADCIRRVQSLYSWEKNSYTGIVYRENCFNNEINHVLDNSFSLSNLKKNVSEKSTVEHVIPVAYFKDRIFNFYKIGDLEKAKQEIIKAFLSPVALIDKIHTNKDNQNKIKDSDFDENYPFKRYEKAGIKIVTHDGKNIDSSWSINDHWDFMSRTSNFSEILKFK